MQKERSYKMPVSGSSNFVNSLRQMTLEEHQALPLQSGDRERWYGGGNEEDEKGESVFVPRLGQTLGG